MTVNESPMDELRSGLQQKIAQVITEHGLIYVAPDEYGPDTVIDNPLELAGLILQEIGRAGWEVLPDELVDLLRYWERIGRDCHEAGFVTIVGEEERL